MKSLLYILLGFLLLLVLPIIGFCVWFFMFFLQVPELKIQEEASNSQKIELIDGYLQDLHDNHKFNGGILLTKNGKPQLAKTYGNTNASKSEQLTIHSSFRLASLSKQYTASGIMLLKERGLIAYDDFVSKYIPNFPYQAVTIRHLLNQTSGIPDQYIQLAKKAKDKVGTLTK